MSIVLTCIGETKKLRVIFLSQNRQQKDALREKLEWWSGGAEERRGLVQGFNSPRRQVLGTTLARRRGNVLTGDTWLFSGGFPSLFPASHAQDNQPS